jgi:hypothetical protein
MVELFRVRLRLLFPFLFGQLKRSLPESFDFQSSALDDHATVGVTEPFQVQTFTPSKGRFLAGEIGVGKAG